jgi:uncharacterized protein (DUF2126 family)
MPPVSYHQSPYAESEWQGIDALGQAVEAKLQSAGVGLTMGGEPTFISCDDFESAQWRTAALGADKRRLGAQLLQRLERRFSPAGALLHYGLGKLYPGEEFPRWALGCYWREDRIPIWHNPALRAEDGKDCGHAQATAERFTHVLATRLGISAAGILPAQESWHGGWAGYVVPLLPVRYRGQLRWSTCRWVLSDGCECLRLLRGKSQIGLRLPLQAIAWPQVLAEEAVAPLDADPTVTEGEPLESPPNSIGIALGVEIRGGRLRVFLPPLTSARGFIDLIGAIEAAAAETGIPVSVEGYPPPINAGISGLQVTPDPGVIEVNIHPAATWSELVEQTRILYEEARRCSLGTQKYTWEGRIISTGGGAHITIGGKTQRESPLLRRPDLLRSLIGYWQNHPSLSYLFSGLFVGPTSQAPRLDEARHETLYELDIAFQFLEPGQEIAPEVLDCLLGNLLVDVTGNRHRSALCIDKLYPANNPRLQLGLLELRGFAMPPHAQMRLLQLLLVRALVACFWDRPHTEPLVRWGTMLHDRFVLPHYICQDLQTVLRDLHGAGYHFKLDWFEPFLEFRFPTCGIARLSDSAGSPLQLELRQGIEPWHVIGDGADSTQSSRLVDGSMERIQVTLRLAGQAHRRAYDVICNHCRLPLSGAAIAGEWVGGVRFRARQAANISHQALAPHRALVFEVVERHTRRSQGGCTYYPSSPHQEGYHGLPKTAAEAAGRAAGRFIPHGPRSEPISYCAAPISSEYPSTLDLRRSLF